jgi:alkanesulfonate monooxygenase SsuD/methylene tetrahydromethanopterin reductase-like flavin-dependent oxidoreductase (luciferase family)
MPHQLRFLAMMPPHLAWPELLRRYRHIEALGFDLAGFADHFVDWTGTPGPWFEGWSLLTAIAVHTSRVRLATWVTQIPLRNPALLARQALTVDHISNGRLELGLGLGLTTDPSCAMMGLPNWSYRERAARFKEYVEIGDRLLSNEVTTYQGQFYRVDRAAMDPRPVQQPRPPIVIAAMGPTMLRHAAEHADNWNSMSFAGTFDAHIAETRDRIRVVDEHCAAIGRDPASLRRSYLLYDMAARQSGGPLDYYGSKDIFVDRVQRLIELGISEIGLSYPRRAEQVPMLEKIAVEVIPTLQAEYAASHARSPR